MTKTEEALGSDICVLLLVKTIKILWSDENIYIQKNQKLAVSFELD
jgi:hypothetical protein